MRVKKNTIKKMVRKQMVRNFNQSKDRPWARNPKHTFETLRLTRGFLAHKEEYFRFGYNQARDELMTIGEAFRWLSKVEYDAKFTAAIRNRMPEILRDTADNLAARILEQLPDGYWKP